MGTFEFVIRCPYCVLGNQFRRMATDLSGFVCGNCGHSAYPGEEKFKCTCRHCAALEEFDNRRRAMAVPADHHAMASDSRYGSGLRNAS
jgi:hypothetical protein